MTICKGSERGNAQQLASYLMRDHKAGAEQTADDALPESAEIAEFRGASEGIPTDSIYIAMNALESRAVGTKAENTLLHCHTSPAPGEQFTEETWARAWQIYEERLGIVGQPYVEVEHRMQDDTNARPPHRHRVYSLINDDGKKINMYRNWFSNELASRQIEFENGFKYTPMAGVENGKKFDHTGRAIKAARTAKLDKLADWISDQAKIYKVKGTAQTFTDAQQEARTHISPAAVREDIIKAWQAHPDDGAAFRAALEAAGLTLARGDKAEVIAIDANGGSHSLQRALNTIKDEDGHRMGSRAAGRAIADLVDAASLPDVAEVRAAIRTTAAETWAADVLTSAADDTPAAPLYVDADKVDPLTALYSTRSSFSDIELRKACLDAAGDKETGEKLFESQLLSEDLITISIDEKTGLRMLTTARNVEAEASLTKSCKDANARFDHKIADDIVTAKIDEWHGTKAFKLKQEQYDSVIAIATGSELVNVRGLAGAGKTTMLECANYTLESQGYKVEAVAPSNRAVGELRGAGMKKAATISSWILKFDREKAFKEFKQSHNWNIGTGRKDTDGKEQTVRDSILSTLDRDIEKIKADPDPTKAGLVKWYEKMREEIKKTSYAKLSPKTVKWVDRQVDFTIKNATSANSVIVIDESGMVGMSLMEDLVSRARSVGAKIVAVGDAEQLQPVEAGAAYRVLTKHGTTVSLEDVVRQFQAWQRRATIELASGDPERAADAMKLYASPDNRIKAVDEWLAGQIKALDAKNLSDDERAAEITRLEESAAIQRENAKTEQCLFANIKGTDVSPARLKSDAERALEREITPEEQKPLELVAKYTAAQRDASAYWREIDLAVKESEATEKLISAREHPLYTDYLNAVAARRQFAAEIATDIDSARPWLARYGVDARTFSGDVIAADPLNGTLPRAAQADKAAEYAAEHKITAEDLTELQDCRLKLDARAGARAQLIADWRADVEANRAAVAANLAKPEAERDPKIKLKSYMIGTYTRADTNALNAAARAIDRDLRAKEYAAAGKELPADQKIKTEAGTLALTIGDRISTTENHKLIKKGSFGEIKDIIQSKDGPHLSILVDGSKEPVIIPAKELSLAYGYASTIHRLQGATVDRTFILHTAQFDRHLHYVGLSRHRESTRIYAATADAPNADAVIRTAREARTSIMLADLIDLETAAAGGLETPEARAKAIQAAMAKLAEMDEDGEQEEIAEAANNAKNAPLSESARAKLTDEQKAMLERIDEYKNLREKAGSLWYVIRAESAADNIKPKEHESYEEFKTIASMRDNAARKIASNMKVARDLLERRKVDKQAFAADVLFASGVQRNEAVDRAESYAEKLFTVPDDEEPTETPERDDEDEETPGREEPDAAPSSDDAPTGRPGADTAAGPGADDARPVGSRRMGAGDQRSADADADRSGPPPAARGRVRNVSEVPVAPDSQGQPDVLLPNSVRDDVAGSEGRRDDILRRPIPETQRRVTSIPGAAKTAAPAPTITTTPTLTPNKPSAEQGDNTMSSNNDGIWRPGSGLWPSGGSLLNSPLLKLFGFKSEKSVIKELKALIHGMRLRELEQATRELQMDRKQWEREVAFQKHMDAERDKFRQEQLAAKQQEIAIRYYELGRKSAGATTTAADAAMIAALKANHLATPAEMAQARANGAASETFAATENLKANPDAAEAKARFDSARVSEAREKMDLAYQQLAAAGDNRDEQLTRRLIALRAEEFYVSALDPGRKDPATNNEHMRIYIEKAIVQNEQLYRSTDNYVAHGAINKRIRELETDLAAYHYKQPDGILAVEMAARERDGGLYPDIEEQTQNYTAESGSAAGGNDAWARMHADDTPVASVWQRIDSDQMQTIIDPETSYRIIHAPDGHAVAIREEIAGGQSFITWASSEASMAEAVKAASFHALQNADADNARWTQHPGTLDTRKEAFGKIVASEPAAIANRVAHLPTITPRFDDSHITRLINLPAESSSDVRFAIMKLNPNFMSFRESEFDRQINNARNENLAPHKLALLTTHNHPQVAYAAALNPSCPLEAVIRACGRDAYILHEVTASERSPLAAIVMASKAEHWGTRAIAAHNGFCPQNILAKLSLDDNPEVRLGVASNLSAPAIAIKQLTEDADREVRRQALETQKWQTEHPVAQTTTAAAAEATPAAAATRPAPVYQAAGTGPDYLDRVAAEQAAHYGTTPEKLGEAMDAAATAQEDDSVLDDYEAQSEKVTTTSQQTADDAPDYDADAAYDEAQALADASREEQLMREDRENFDEDAYYDALIQFEEERFEAEHPNQHEEVSNEIDQEYIDYIDSLYDEDRDESPLQTARMAEAAGDAETATRIYVTELQKNPDNPVARERLADLAQHNDVAKSGLAYLALAGEDRAAQAALDKINAATAPAQAARAKTTATPAQVESTPEAALARAHEKMALLEKSKSPRQDQRIYTAVAKDLAEAARLGDKAAPEMLKAMADHPLGNQANFELGKMYDEGIGVEKNADAAVAHYTEAYQQSRIGTYTGVDMKELPKFDHSGAKVALTRLAYTNKAAALETKNWGFKNFSNEDLAHGARAADALKTANAAGQKPDQQVLAAATAAQIAEKLGNKHGERMAANQLARLAKDHPAALQELKKLSSPTAKAAVKHIEQGLKSGQTTLADRCQAALGKITHKGDPKQTPAAQWRADHKAHNSAHSAWVKNPKGQQAALDASARRLEESSVRVMAETSPGLTQKETQFATQRATVALQRIAPVQAPVIKPGPKLG